MLKVLLNLCLNKILSVMGNKAKQGFRCLSSSPHLSFRVHSYR